MGSVIAIGDIVPVQSAAGPKIRRTVVIEDVEYVYEYNIIIIIEINTITDFKYTMSNIYNYFSGGFVWIVLSGTTGQNCGMSMRISVIQWDM